MIRHDGADNAQAHAAAQQHVQRILDTQVYAANKSRAAAVRTLQRDRTRASRQLEPYVLSLGARVRVSYEASNTVRQQLKSRMIKALSRMWTEEIYVVRERRLAPHSKRIILYDLQCSDVEDGAQGSTRIGSYEVALPLRMNGMDRRWLVACAEPASKRMVARYPRAVFAWHMMGK